jgi:hypothetical protein
MPSDKALTNVTTGAGKLHSNVATAAADLQMSSGTEALLASVVAALQQELAFVTRSAGAAGAGQTSLGVSGTIWLGDGSVSTDIEDFFRLVTEPYNGAPVEADGTPITISSLTGANIGDGWYTGSLTLNFSGPIAAGQFWQVYYTNRALLQSLPTDAFSFNTVRNTITVNEQLQEVLRDLHSGGAADVWDDAWASTILDLAYSGLDDRYRRSTTGAGNLDTPGDGAIITRDGQAPTVEATADFGIYFYPNVTADPYTAHFMTRAGPGPQSDTNHRVNTDGGTGYVGILQQRLCNSPVMRLNALAYTQASRLDVIERSFTGPTIGSGNVRTRVTPGNTVGASLNPLAGSGFNDRRAIHLATNDYFWEAASGNKTSEVALGRDMIEITYPSGDKIVCVITEFPNAGDSRLAYLENLTGGGLSFPDGGGGAPITGVSFRFIKTKYWQGCGNQQYTDFESGYLITESIKLGQFYHAITPFVTDEATPWQVEDIGDAEFFARAQTIGQSGVANLTEKPYALKWGGYDPENYIQEVRGGLRGDGAVEASQYNIQTRIAAVSAAGAWDLTWHPSLEGSRLIIRMFHAAGTAAITLSLDTDYLTNVAAEGDEIEVVLINTGFAAAPGPSAYTGPDYSIIWPAEFQFSGDDGQPIIYNFNGQVTAQKFKGTFDSAAFGKFLMTKTTYVGPGD